MEVIRGTENGTEVETSTTEGVVQSVDEATLQLSPPASGVKAKNVEGMNLAIQKKTDEIDLVFFPRIFSQLDLGEILQHHVMYSRRLWSFREGSIGNLNHYTFTIRGTNRANDPWEIKEEFTH